ncbi:MAG: hypothetical protein JNL52_08900 [Flavobacteriales bacterium]|nr:hypothetical protein [Flavobacteriales bacterium]
MALQEKLTATDLINAEWTFNQHFRLNNPERSPIQNTRTMWPWDELLRVLDDHQDVDVQGIYIDHGLAEGRFIPVLEFYYEKLDGSMAIKPDSAYIYGHGGFQKITDAQRKALVERYMTDVLVKRKAASAFEPLRINEEPRDPRATSYPFEGKVFKLLGDNPNGSARSLVISCISAEATYAELGGVGNDPEFRHVLCMHVSRPRLVDGALVMVDLLDDKDHGSFAYKAMDMGTLCPPSCTLGRP